MMIACKPCEGEQLVRQFKGNLEPIEIRLANDLEALLNLLQLLRGHRLLLGVRSRAVLAAAAGLRINFQELADSVLASGLLGLPILTRLARLLCLVIPLHDQLRLNRLAPSSAASPPSTPSLPLLDAAVLCLCSSLIAVDFQSSDAGVTYSTH